MNRNSKQTAFMATLHCLTGCAIGEVLGMVIGAFFNMHNLTSIFLSILLAFFFGYSLTLFSLLKHMNLTKSLSLAFASDTVSISVMELVDNLIIFLIPGALDASLNTFLFWGSLAFSIFIAFLSAFPVNYYLINRGKGHALVHSHH